LHANANWPKGLPVGVYCLRHSVARPINGKKLHFGATATWLGHEPKTEMGTVATYLRSPFTDLWSLRTRIAVQAFGPLKQWPDLRENLQLLEVLQR
jgi:hypothetical protein